MTLSRLGSVVICSIILSKVCVLVSGRYVMEVDLFGYNNPTQTCQDCRSGGQFAPPGCCDRHSSDICNGGDRCDSYFYYCLRTIDSSGRGCSYFGNKVSAVNMDDVAVNFINQSLVLGLENPLQLQGLTDAYDASAGIQLYIEIQDNDDNNADDFIDVILINHTSSVGIESERQNHSGLFGFVTMDLSITVLCAENFQGPSCTDCSRPGFTGPNCDEIDNCLGVDCGSGECVKDINSFSCTCDPGYTGERCEDTISTVTTSELVDDMSGRDLIGPIIGGVLGGLCVLLILVLLAVIVIFVLILNHRKSKDKPTISHSRQEPVSTGQGMKTAINQLYEGSASDEQDTDNLPFYEEVPDFKAQYVNFPSDGTVRVNSVLVNNPIYGDENGNTTVTVDTGDRFDHYDQTFQQPAPGASDKEFSASYDRINLQVSTKENVAYSRMDSELEDNPLYGGEGVGVVAIQGDGAAISAISPHHEYDRTFQPPQTPANGMKQEARKSNATPAPGPEEEQPTNKKLVYDYVDTNI